VPNTPRSTLREAINLLRRKQNDVTEYWNDLVFDKLTNEQAVMHYSKHRLTASVAYVPTLTYASTNDHWARSVCRLVSSSKL